MTKLLITASRINGTYKENRNEDLIKKLGGKK